MSFQGAATVTTAGTRVPLVASTVTTPTLRFCARVTIFAKPANTQGIYVGDSAVSSTNYGMKLLATDADTMGSGNNLQNPIDLATVYVDADVNGEGVKFFAEQV